MAALGIHTGLFDKRVTFKNVTFTTDAAGGSNESYTNFLTTWANVTPISGFRNFNEGFDGLVNRKTFKVFYHSSLATNLKKDTRIVYDSRDFSIDRVQLIAENKNYYLIEATEIH